MVSKILSRFQDRPVMTASVTPHGRRNGFVLKNYHKTPVLSIEKRCCTRIFGRKGLHKGDFMV